MIKQEQYVKSVTLKQPITKTQRVVLKIMAYEPDTYMSASSITLTTTIQVNEN